MLALKIPPETCILCKKQTAQLSVSRQRRTRRRRNLAGTQMSFAVSDATRLAAAFKALEAVAAVLL